MAMVLFVPYLLLGAELIWQISIGYPPTLEQIHFGVSSPFFLWASRFFSLSLILATIFFLSSTISPKAKKYYWIFILACPTISLLWMSYPLDALKIFLISGVFYLMNKFKKKLIITTIVSATLLLILNIVVFKEKPTILETLSLAKPQEEVILRFNAEDKLKPNIKIPTSVRRIGYNKYYIAAKNSLNEALTFFDFETLFFQEVHPLGQKAFVIFFWPEIYILSLSILLMVKKNQKMPKEILPLFVLAFIYFITTNVSTERRLILTVFPLVIIMSESIHLIFEGTYKKTKIAIIFLLFLSFYGWITNYYDRFIRPDYWLDNRPIAYNFFMSYLKNQKLNYNQILIPDILYSTKDYCSYYLKDCSLFKDVNFDLTKISPESGSLYIGFTGNFLGQEKKDVSLSEITSVLSGKELRILKTKHILNNIVDGYGQELLIVDSIK